jgi:trk/ktr system potassium uptake protein
LRARTLLLTIGGVLAVAATAMAFALLVAIIYSGEDTFALAVSTVATAGSGIALWMLGKRWPDQRQPPSRVAFLVVTVGWMAMATAGAVPFYLYARLPRPIFSKSAQTGPHTGGIPITQCKPGEKKIGQEFCSFTNCFFESMSGFTTTGASIVSRGLWESPEKRSGLPHGILMWRAIIQWLGGMGIVLLALAIFPFLGIAGFSLYRAEVPGPTKEKLTPRLARTAMLLWAVYAGLTLAQIVLMWPVTGLYQAITHSFTTMATGGFSTLALSVGGFHNAYIEWIIIIFMFLAGANFALHAWALIRGKFSVYLHDSEFIAYGLATLVATSIVAYLISPAVSYPFRQSMFQIVSLVTTTGYASADFELWGNIAGANMVPFWIVLVMFMGGCAGSTGGGPKVMRWIIITKQVFRELFLYIHPKAVHPIHYCNHPVPNKVLQQISSFLIIYTFLFVLGTAIVAAGGYDLMTATTASISSLGNIGPGLGRVGPMDNYEHFPAFVKWSLSFLMIFGRLEVVTVFVILTPEYWRS